MPSTLRQLWKDAKEKNKKNIDMTKVSDKTKLGPSLDKYQELLDAYVKLTHKQQRNPDEAKEKKAREAVKAAAKVAADACGDYILSLKEIVKLSDGPTRQAADDLLTVLSMNIKFRLIAAVKGEF